MNNHETSLKYSADSERIIIEGYIYIYMYIIWNIRKILKIFFIFVQKKFKCIEFNII